MLFHFGLGVIMLLWGVVWDNWVEWSGNDGEYDVMVDRYDMVGGCCEWWRFVWSDNDGIGYLWVVFFVGVIVNKFYIGAGLPVLGI